MRPRPSIFALFAALLPACPALHAAADIIGNLEAVRVTPQDREYVWVNPANLSAAGDSSGLEAGFSGMGHEGAYAALAHFPLGFSAGFGLGTASVEQARWNDDPAIFMAFALAKRGFGASPWLSGLSLGLDTRRITLDEYDARYGEGEIRTHWALDGGMAWDLPPWGGWGRLQVGFYALQTRARSGAERLLGSQWQWRDESGLWDAEVNYILMGDSRPARENSPYWFGYDADPTGRLALAFHVGWFDLAGQALLGDALAAGPAVRLNIPTRTRLRRVSLEASGYAWNGSAAPRMEASFGLRATFLAGRREPARTYGEYRSRMPPGSEAAPPPPADTGVAPVAILDQATWEQREALYQDGKIGVWRGIVWPYANTFGYLTTFLIPSGTSCLGVGDFGPGFALMGAWAALAAYATIGDASPEMRGTFYGVGQIGLKLTDLVLSQIHVRRYNRDLRRRLKLAVMPGPGGASLAAGLTF